MRACLVHIDDLLHDVLHEAVRRLNTRVDGGITEELTRQVDGTVVNVGQQVSHAVLLHLLCITNTGS